MKPFKICLQAFLYQFFKAYSSAGIRLRLRVSLKRSII